MNSITASDTGETENGPMWGRFFDSIGAHDDTDSVVSGSHALEPSTPSRLTHSHMGNIGSPASEVHPNDSASVVDDERASEILQSGALGATSSVAQLPVVPVDDGTYVFKFRTLSNNTHRFQARNDNIENLRDIVTGKLALDPYFVEWDVEKNGPRPDPNDFQLQYTDADGDIVVMSSDTDVADAVKIARDAHSDRVVLSIHGGKSWKKISIETNEQEKPVPPPLEIKNVKVEEQTPVSPVLPPVKAPSPAPVPQDTVFGIPRDLLLPASVGALAVVIIGVFTISRLNRD